MSKVLITGGAGFIGYHLARLLLGNSRADLTLVDSLQWGKIDRDLKGLLKNKRVRFLKLDLTRPMAYKKLGSGYNHIYHLAAINGTKRFYEMPEEVLRINTLSLVYMLEWFRRKNKNGKFLFTSSNEAYAGALEAFGKLPLPTPEKVPLVIVDPYNPRWSYAGTKLIGEQFVIHYAQKYKLRAVLVRPHNFYGPRSGFDHVIPEFLQRIARRVDPFHIYGADNTRTFCYITDAVRAMAMLMTSPKTDKLPVETIHIGASEEITMRRLAERLFRICRWRPKKLEIHKAPAGSVKRRRPDIKKIIQLVGWRPKISLDKGLILTRNWYL